MPCVVVLTWLGLFFFFFGLQGKCPSSVHTKAPDEPDLSRNNGLGKACLDDQSTASHPHNGGKLFFFFFFFLGGKAIHYI